MPVLDPPASIKLRVKVPPGHIEGDADEFALEGDLPVNLSVGQVRQRIQQTVPSNPSPERQRLLYAGRALVDNEQSLADALNIRRDPSQTEYVIHLLIKGDGQATGPPRRERGVSASASSTAAPVATAQQAQVPAAQQQHPHGQPPHPRHDPLQDLLLRERQAIVIAQQHQQQRLHAQLLQAQQNAQQNMLAGGQHHGLVLPGTQHMMPPQMFPGQYHPQAQAMPIQMQHAPHGQGQDDAHQRRVEGSANARRSTTSASAEQANGQQRSASQPPPRPHGHGVFVQGTGPNGERISIHHHTQVLNAQNPHLMAQMPLFNPPAGFGGMGLLPGMPPLNTARRNGPSALDQARDNVAEMRRLLEELRTLESANQDYRARIQGLEQRTQALNDYIDPLHLGTANNTRMTSTPANVRPTGEHLTESRTLAGQSHGSASQLLQDLRQPLAPPNSSDVTCYLLSSPSGPYAIVYSSHHGTFTSRPRSTTISSIPTQTSTDAHPEAPNQDNQLAPADQPVVVQPALQQAPVAQPDEMGPLAPLVGHFWLLLRILIFSYFLLGANLGWRKPLALAAIGVGFWLIRQGLLGEGGVVRRWWDGIVHEGRPQAAQNQQGPAGGNQQAAAAAGNARPGQMPTPAEVAQRLLDEDRRQRNDRIGWIREQLRPVERATALLVASLWPGVGEAYVRAIEQEERRRAEEEIAARRREEEARERAEEEEKKKAEAGAQGGASSEEAPDDADAKSGSPAVDSEQEGEKDRENTSVSEGATAT
jgi:hypothetical protein